MPNQSKKDFVPGQGKFSLPIIGGLILFSVILGTTNLGYIPVPTEARNATTMHLPTIVASLLEGWPVGMVVGMVFGITSMYMGSSAMSQDPLIALMPRVLIGFTPFFTYMLLKGYNDYLRIGSAAVVGTLTNTFLFLGMAVLRGFLPLDKAVNIALIHGLPEALVAVVIVIPAVKVLRKTRSFLNKMHD